MGAPIPTNTVRPPIMTTDPKLLTLVQWLSPSYPIGAFAWSHGLEAAVSDGWVTDAESLGAWLEGLVSHGSIRTDAIFIALAYGAAQNDIDALNDTVKAYAASKERLREAERQGAAFAKITRDVWFLDLPDLQLPVALGRAGRLAGLDPTDLVSIYAHGFCSNLVAAAQRLMKLGQSDAQMVLAKLNTGCLELAQFAQSATLDDIHSEAFLSDISSMRHETVSHRIFQS